MPDNTRTVTVRRVTPAAFAAWLHAQGQEPSTHVLAWFKNKGVAWPPVTASGADAAPAAGPAVLLAEDVHDLAGLAQYRLAFQHLPAQQRPKWLLKHVAIVRAAVSAHGHGGEAAVAKQLGMSAQRVAEILQRHPEPVPEKASPFDGLLVGNKAA